MNRHDRRKLGATGKFPDGKLNQHDEGELLMAIARRGEQVIIEFGKPIAWFSLSPEQAREFAALILQRANEPTTSGHA
jgi:hypothetical protein